MFTRNHFIILSLSAILSGCASVGPSTLGIPESQWASYNSQQRKEIIKNYHELQKKQNAEQKDNAATSVEKLNVTIQGGKVNMPPSMGPANYQPIMFEISTGQCNKSINVIALDDTQQKTTFKACYKNHVLYLDPSRFDVTKAQGSIQLPYQPVWKRGFTYPNINSTGFTSFSNANITIKMLAGNE